MTVNRAQHRVDTPKISAEGSRSTKWLHMGKASWAPPVRQTCLKDLTARLNWRDRNSALLSISAWIIHILEAVFQDFLLITSWMAADYIVPIIAAQILPVLRTSYFTKSCAMFWGHNDWSELEQFPFRVRNSTGCYSTVITVKLIYLLFNWIFYDKARRWT
jgi:hypothetical protein